MTDNTPDKNDQNDDQPREPWTWQRPDDGSPVFGADQSAPVDHPGHSAPPPLPPVAASPVLGAAIPPSQRGPQYSEQYPPEGYPPPDPYAGQHQAPPPPPSYSNQPPYQGGGAWQQPPAQQGWGPPPYGAPPPAPPVGVGPGGRADGLLTLSFSLSYGFLILGVCCQPLGMMGGMGAIIAAYVARRRAIAAGGQEPLANTAIVLGVITLLLNLTLLVISILLQLLMPDFQNQMMKSFGLG